MMGSKQGSSTKFFTRPTCLSCLSRSCWTGASNTNHFTWSTLAKYCSNQSASLIVIFVWSRVCAEISKMLNKRKTSPLCGPSFLPGQIGSAAWVKAPGQEQATQATSCRAQWLSSVQNSLEYYRELEHHFWLQRSSSPILKQSPYLWLHICLDYNFLDGIILAASCLAHSRTVLPRARAPLLNTGILNTLHFNS